MWDCLVWSPACHVGYSDEFKTRTSRHFIAVQLNGKATDFDSVDRGSIPRTAATRMFIGVVLAEMVMPLIVIEAHTGSSPVGHPNKHLMDV